MQRSSSFNNYEERLALACGEILGWYEKSRADFPEKEVLDLYALLYNKNSREATLEYRLVCAHIIEIKCVYLLKREGGERLRALLTDLAHKAMLP